MSYHRKLKSILYLVTAVFAIISIGFTALQLTYQESVFFSILNNISICVLTGCIIALIQAIIGYKTAKHDSLLIFYKDAIMLEDKIIHYPYMSNGFVNAAEGLKNIREILTLFSSTIKLSYLQIDMSDKSDKELKAAKNLFATYATEINNFKKFENALYEAVGFMEKTDEELIKEGITNIQLETHSVNENLQQHEISIRNSYNDASLRKNRNSAYEILEKYLFQKKLHKQ